jgi:hypothetical protein
MFNIINGVDVTGNPRKPENSMHGEGNPRKPRAWLKVISKNLVHG